MRIAETVRAHSRAGFSRRGNDFRSAIAHKRQTRKLRRGEQGLTLVELIVTVAILGDSGLSGLSDRAL